MALTFQELKMIKPMDDYNQNHNNVLIFPSVCGLSSHIIENLLFRLENVEKDTQILLLDKRKITSNEVKKGLYVNKDFSKSRSSVLANRYTGLTKVKLNATSDDNLFAILKRISRNTTEQGNPKEPKNIFVVDTQTTDSLELKAKLTSVQSALENTNHKVIYMVVYVNSDTVSVFNFTVNAHEINGDFIEYENKDNIKSRGITNGYMRNLIASQIVFNMINNVVTQDLSQNKTVISLNYKEQVKSKYIFNLELSEDSVFKLLQEVTKAPKSTVIQLNSDFTTWLSEQESEEFTTKVNNYYNKEESKIKLYQVNLNFHSLASFIYKEIQWEITTKNLSYAEFLEINIANRQFDFQNVNYLFENESETKIKDSIKLLIMFLFYIQTLDN